MADPWIELEEIRGPDQEEPHWQAIFASQVEILPYNKWVNLKWGFNASALFDETLERQRLFFESQYATQGALGFEPPDQRAFALRFINRPGEGLLVTVLGRIQAGSREQVLESSRSYFRELTATFPYDYTLVPALSRQEFDRLSGKDILGKDHVPASLAQIKRQEYPMQLARGSHVLQGYWQSGPRAHEQVWRSLAASSLPILMNLSLRSTVLYEKERAKITTSIKEISDHHGQSSNPAPASLKNKDRLEQRLAPMKKLFYLQIHLVSTGKLSEDLFRTIGTSLTLTSKGELHPGYQVILPEGEEAKSWRKKLKDLEIIFTTSFLPIYRLSEIADLDEVFEVVRLPYSPPDHGFPDFRFYSTKIKTEGEN